MATTEQSPGPLGLLPGFRPPVNLRLDPPLPEVEGESPTTADPEATPEGRQDLPDRPAPRPAGTRAATRTATSSTGDAPPELSAKETAVLIAGLLGLAVAGVAGLVRWRGRRQLRRPTDAQLGDIAAPLARIALRHVPAALLNKDLADAGLAGAAVGVYLNGGPLLEPVHVDPGVPADLAGDPEQEIR